MWLQPGKQKNADAGCVIMWRLGLWGGHKQRQTTTFSHNVGKSSRGKTTETMQQSNRFHFFFWAIFLDLDTAGTKTSPLLTSKNLPISDRSAEPALKWNPRSFVILNTASMMTAAEASRSTSLLYHEALPHPWGVLLFYKWALMQEKVT